MYSSGTSCLEETLGYDEAALERAVKGRRTLATRIRHTTGTVFDNEEAMIKSLIQGFIALDPHHQEVLRAIRNLNDFKQYVSLNERRERTGSQQHLAPRRTEVTHAQAQ